jgi:hypothetical protein
MNMKAFGVTSILNSNITSFFRFVDKRAIYRWYNLIRTCAGECDWLFHWQHNLCATISANVDINYCLPIKVYYRICTVRHIRIEISHGIQNDVLWVLTWVSFYVRYILIMRVGILLKWPHNFTKREGFCTWSTCAKSGKCALLYLCIRGVDFNSFCNFSIGFCSNSVLFFI